MWFDDTDEMGVVFETLSKGESDDQQAVPGGTGEAANVTVLLVLFGLLHR